MAIVDTPFIQADLTTASTISQGEKILTSSLSPQQLVASQTLVESVEIFARQSITVANVGNIYLGINGSQKRVLAPGESFTFTAPRGKKIDLSKIYVDAATANDAVTWIALS